MKLVLSTSNIMGGGPSVIRRTNSKSNAELTSSLRANFSTHRALDNATHDVVPQSFRSWTQQEGDCLYVPAAHFNEGLQEERSAYDITVKLFYLPNIPASRRCQQTKEAIELVLKELHVDSIDLLIVSYPDMAFDADDESEEDELENSPSVSAASDPSAGGVEDIESMIQTWRTLEALQTRGVISKLGLAEFGAQRLAKFIAAAKVRPSVDQINVRDCCVVPKSLIIFAKQQGIELLTHNDCTNILPRGTLRELLGPPDAGVGLLTAPGRKSEPGSEALAGDVEPQWVVKYTAVVKDRGVVENKGYFAVAELNTSSR